MEEIREKIEEVALVPKTTVRKIRCGVVIGHVAFIIVPLAVVTILSWIVTKPPPTITVAFYDPKLDKIVDNPSPIPSPDNPIPPSGTPDGGGAAPPEPAPADPEPVAVTDPSPINYQLPKAIMPQPKTKVAQPKIKNIVRQPEKPAAKAKPAPDKSAAKPDPRRTADDVKPYDPNRQSSDSASGATGRGRSGGPLGSNSEPGHVGPGGQLGNSGYEIQVAMMIESMWITPESVRLGGREPRVLIELEVDPAGRVTSKHIVTKSGVLAMDESVASLLADLYKVKAPFDGKSHTLTFWLKARKD